MQEDSHDRRHISFLQQQPATHGPATDAWPRHGCMECRWRLSIVCIRLPLSAARCKVVKPLGSLACTSVTCMRVLSLVASALFFAEDDATTTSSSSAVVRPPCQRHWTLFCVVVRVRVQLKSAVLGVTHVVEAAIVSRALGDELSATTAILRMRSPFDLFCVPRDRLRTPRPLRSTSNSVACKKGVTGRLGDSRAGQHGCCALPPSGAGLCMDAT
jgi:hypothetical protein